MILGIIFFSLSFAGAFVDFLKTRNKMSALWMAGCLSLVFALIWGGNKAAVNAYLPSWGLTILGLGGIACLLWSYSVDKKLKPQRVIFMVLIFLLVLACGIFVIEHFYTNDSFLWRWFAK